MPLGMRYTEAKGVKEERRSKTMSGNALGRLRSRMGWNGCITADESQDQRMIFSNSQFCTMARRLSFFSIFPPSFPSPIFRERQNQGRMVGWTVAFVPMCAKKRPCDAEKRIKRMGI